MYSNISGLKIYYQEAGAGKNLIMLHGWKHDVSSFWGVIPLLKDRFKVWLIDLPGFGRSDLPSKAFTTSDYAEVIKDFIEVNKIKDPILLGHSLGGRVAIKLASKYPKLIDKLILEDSAGIKPNKDFFKAFIYPFAKAFHYFMPNLLNIKNKLRYNFYKSLESDYVNAGKLKDTLTNILAEDLTNDLKDIKAMTLLIWGEKDATSEASLKHGKRMYRMIHNSKIEIFDGVGHSPHLEKPELFSYYVKDFS